jgi:hypothetical protein
MDIKRSEYRPADARGVDSFDAALGKPFEPTGEQKRAPGPPRVSGDVEDRQRALLVKQTRPEPGVLSPAKARSSLRWGAHVQRLSQ